MWELAHDTLTLWHATGTAKKALWSRRTINNARIELTSAANTSERISSASARLFKVFIFRELVIRPGDFIAQGKHLENSPVQEAFKVETVTYYTDGSARQRFHHIEAVGR